MRGSKSTFSMYGTEWTGHPDPLMLEMQCVRLGGSWLDENGNKCGRGLFYHFKRAQEILWPFKVWHRWSLLELEHYLTHRIIAEIGPASSGKSFSAASNCLFDYYCWPEETTVLVCSTEREMLEMRVWGSIKQLHKIAKENFPFLAGYLIDSRQRIVTDEKKMGEGRDFRSGVCGVPCKRGSTFTGMGSFAGIKNKRVRLVADEASLLPMVFLDAISNLGKNPDFKCLALGNPKSVLDALGRVSEPNEAIGGWESGIDQSGGTKTWPTRMDGGVCIQLVGSDSPNLDGHLGIPLITQAQIDSDVRFYGRDSLQFTMMNEGRMPRGEGSRRVLTRQIAMQGGAMEPPIWLGGERTKIGFLDAAYGAVGGDRAIFGELQFGLDVNRKQILALIETMLVPVSVRETVPPEDQIVGFCRAQCERRGIPGQNFFYDAAMRTSLVMAFSRIWTPKCQSIDSMGPATERPVDTTLFVTDTGTGRRRLKTCREHYSKFVTELWFSVRYAVEAKQFKGMTEEVLQEGYGREWGMVSGSRIELEPKQKMKERMGLSPDQFDAVAYGVEGARQRGFQIARLTPAEAEEEDRRWHSQMRERAARLRDSFTLTYN